MNDSYHRYALVQKGQGLLAQELIRHFLQDIRSNFNLSAGEQMTVIDYGCSSGVNSVGQLREIVSASSKQGLIHVHALMLDYQESPQLWERLDGFLELVKADACNHDVQFTYQPTTHDFYTPLTEEHKPCLPAALGFCCVSAHWISKLPSDMPHAIVGNQLPEGSTRQTWESQAREDWQTFLKLRATEIRPGGKLILSIPGRFADGDFVCREAWDVFSSIKGEMKAEGLLDEEGASLLASREYWRSEAEFMEPFHDDVGVFWEILHYSQEKRACPFLTKLHNGEFTAEQCADGLITAFQGFLSVEFNAALQDAAPVFWERARQRALSHPESMDLHVCMHHFALHRSNNGQ